MKRSKPQARNRYQASTNSSRASTSEGCPSLAGSKSPPESSPALSPLSLESASLLVSPRPPEDPMDILRLPQEREIEDAYDEGPDFQSEVDKLYNRYFKEQRRRNRASRERIYQRRVEQAAQERFLNGGGDEDIIRCISDGY